MHETATRIFEDALTVMNRAMGEPANPALLFEGTGADQSIFVTVYGSNADEDDSYTLRMGEGGLEIADHTFMRIDTHPVEGWTIRLDDLKRIAEHPERFARDPSAVAKLMAH